MFDAVAVCLNDLRRRYGEPWRAYHDMSHIEALLEEYARVKNALHCPPAVELAIWYHDAVYRPERPDNEEQSAALLRADLGTLAAPELVARAEAMVLATKRHALPASGDAEMLGDCAFFLDMDLSILGAADDAFARYDAGIAREYEPHYGRAAFRAGRLGVLRTFLARERLFLTADFHDRLEARARANLARSIAVLAGAP